MDPRWHWAWPWPCSQAAFSQDTPRLWSFSAEAPSDGSCEQAFLSINCAYQYMARAWPRRDASAKTSTSNSKLEAPSGLSQGSSCSRRATKSRTASSVTGLVSSDRAFAFDSADSSTAFFLGFFRRFRFSLGTSSSSSSSLVAEVFSAGRRPVRCHGEKCGRRHAVDALMAYETPPPPRRRRDAGDGGCYPTSTPSPRPSR